MSGRARHPYHGRVISDEHAEDISNMVNVVNLDALIPREDFEVDDKASQITRIEKLPIRDSVVHPLIYL
jgi:hypothetical protein